MYSGGAKPQPSPLPADVLRELDPLANQSSAAVSAGAASAAPVTIVPRPRAGVAVGPALPLPPPSTKPKPSVIGRSGASGFGATQPPATATAAPSHGLAPTSANSPSFGDFGDRLIGLQPPESSTVGATSSVWPPIGSTAAMGIQRPTGKPTVIRPKGRAPVPSAPPTSTSTAASSTTNVMVSSGSATAANQLTSAARSIVPSRPAPPRPGKPAPPRPTKGPSRPPPPISTSQSVARSQVGANGLHSSRSLADLEGLVWTPPIPPSAQASKTCVDDIAVHPSMDGSWPKLPPRPGKGHPLFHYMITEPHAVALYEYNATRADELSFKENDVILLKKKITDDWLYGCIDEREGMFPSSFVTIKKDLPVTTDQVDAGLTGPRCVARFEFEAEQDGDLGFVEGEIIQLLERIGLEWLRGTKGGKTGCFPAAFVEVIEDLPQDIPGSREAHMPAAPVETSSVVCSVDPNLAIATFDFFARDDTELTLKSGDCVYVLAKWTEDWLYGEANGACGLFPAQFIDHVPSELPPWNADAYETNVSSTADASSAPCANADNDLCIALYDFEAQADGDLSIVAGDRIRVLSRINLEWWEGELGERTGIFPAAFVQQL